MSNFGTFEDLTLLCLYKIYKYPWSMFNFGQKWNDFDPPKLTLCTTEEPSEEISAI